MTKKLLTFLVYVTRTENDNNETKLTYKIQVKINYIPYSRSAASHHPLQQYLKPDDQKHISADPSQRAERQHEPIHPRMSN